MPEFAQNFDGILSGWRDEQVAEPGSNNGGPKEPRAIRISREGARGGEEAADGRGRGRFAGARPDIPLTASVILGLLAIVVIFMTLATPRGTGVPVEDIPESAVLSYEDPEPVRAVQAPDYENLDFVMARGRLRASWALRDVATCEYTSRVGILGLADAFELWGTWYCIEHEGQFESEASGADVTVVLAPPEGVDGDPRRFWEDLLVWNAPVGPRLWWDEDIHALVVHDIGGYVDLPHAHRDVLEVVAMNAGNLQGWTILAVNRIEPYAPGDSSVFALAVEGEVSGSEIEIKGAFAGSTYAEAANGTPADGDAIGQPAARSEQNSSRISAILEAARWYADHIAACRRAAPGDGIYWAGCSSGDEAREASEYLKALSASGIRVRLDGDRLGCDDPEMAYGILAYIRFGRNHEIFSR